ncbi:recQ-mediated genome instability protein 1 isoform X2 [Macadamia integrifolia]|uniref:recQ-mediated genome instability protein 1 isoform X2 n=1 Tax=Macadamia integrifolia TaxID=60698 RepID=UPI001C4E8E26|nr:recQ-mediated genome instability protein 1 isoform X2 [Macadamia integrifolia]
MSRRRLQLHYSSSEEDDQGGHRGGGGGAKENRGLAEPTIVSSTTSSYSPNPNTGHGTGTNPNSASASAVLSENIPLDISDDDFFDAPERQDIPTPPPHSGQEDCRDSSVDAFLRGLGLSLRREWLVSCIAGLQSSLPGFSGLDVPTKAKLCFEQFLVSDMNYSGGGVLPHDVHTMHLVDLGGPFVLQVDEIVNISCPLRNRYQNAASGIKRCLKLSMTDGVQRVFGMEYRPIKDLEVLAPAGLKVAIRNANVRRGLLMLVPEVLEVLGGLVEDLDAACQRLVHEVNKPPRGKRTRTGVVPSLVTRATLAAWPSNNDNNQGHSDNSASVGATRSQRLDEAAGSVSAVPGSAASEMAMEEVAPTHAPNAEANMSSDTLLDVEDINMIEEVEHPLILTGDNEIPFMYLSSLLAKWAAKEDGTPFVQGIIKRATFELLIYVEDGSLISEILIDHNVVQKGIGYSPEEVTAALSSSDTKRVSDMKECMKQFQTFLTNFEGTMLVEINSNSPLPVALEMNQGCSTSDAWFLLRRLKSSTPAETPQHPHSDPIILSP